MKTNKLAIFNNAGMFTLSIRFVVGWTYFSALWRRLVLTNKLDPDAAGYIGEKFNHFLPHALGIKPIIQYLVTYPDALWVNMLAFTLIEGIVGLFIMLGFFTRLMSIGVIALALGILLGSGWIGTTCLDEWQIGILGIATGFALFLSGGGTFSLDAFLTNKGISFTQKKGFSKWASGALPLSHKKLAKLSLIGSLIILFVTLFTNQYFHGGVWGTLHNKSVKPKVEISNFFIKNDTLQFTVFRTEGVDVYGSFLIGIDLLNSKKEKVLSLNGNDLSHFNLSQINNAYVAKVKPGSHSLIIPLGAKATLNIKHTKLKKLPPDTYTLVLTDVSGVTWTGFVTLTLTLLN